MNQDNIYMRRALELASLGEGYTGTNPKVGAVVVAQGRIIGEGYHHRYGEAHAEVMAIRSIRGSDRQLLPESTIYVTLEPCSHYGKTPPCALLLIESGIKHVVVAQLDPYPAVSGRGVAMLREAGIAVEAGCEEDLAQELNKPFNSYYAKAKPYTLLKWAESADGYIDLERSTNHLSPFVFSSPYRQRLVHKLRRNYQAILIGANTALLDNPSLTNRYWSDVQPIRIVLDWRLTLENNLRLFTDEAAPTWVVYDGSLTYNVEFSQSIRYCPLDIVGKDRTAVLLDFLHAEGIQSLIIEGGSRTLQEFVDKGYYDEIQRERSRVCLQQGIAAPKL